MGMPGLLQPPGPVDPIQRLALMMAIMVLGMPQVYSCNIATSCGVSLGREHHRAKNLPIG
jgi:hypothetical protein